MGKRQHNNDEEKKNKKTKVDEEVEETPEVNEVKSKKEKKNKKQSEENVVSSPIKEKKEKKDKKNKKNKEENEVMEEVEESTEKKTKKDKKNKKDKKEKTEEVEEKPVEKDEEDEFQIVSPTSTTANAKGKLSISSQNVPVDNDFVEVYVNGFPFECTEDSVRELFGQHGTIDSVTVPTFPDNPNKAKGFGFVKFTTNEEAKKSLALNGYQWGKRTLKVEPRLSKESGGRPGGDNKFNKNNTRFFNKGGNNNSFGGGGGGGGGANKFNSGPLSGNPDKDCDTLFCGNLSYEIQDADFYEFFKNCGEISQIRYGEDKETGKFKGFAFVQFNNRNAVIKGGELNGQDLKGRNIKIDYAAPKRR